MIELPEILSDEELLDAFGETLNEDILNRGQRLKEVAKAEQLDMLRWFVEWAEGDCDCGRMTNFARVFCKYCWQKLKQKLAELEGK